MIIDYTGLFHEHKKEDDYTICTAMDKYGKEIIEASIDNKSEYIDFKLYGKSIFNPEEYGSTVKLIIEYIFNCHLLIYKTRDDVYYLGAITEKNGKLEYEPFEATEGFQIDSIVRRDNLLICEGFDNKLENDLTLIINDGNELNTKEVLRYLSTQDVWGGGLCLANNKENATDVINFFEEKNYIKIIYINNENLK